MSEFDLERGLQEILEQIKQLNEKLDRMNLPQLPPWPLPQPGPQPLPNQQFKQTCQKCGISLAGVMGYVCTDYNCPTFLQVR